MKREYGFLLVWLLFINLHFTGCGTLPNGRSWGEDVTLLPGWATIGEAALKVGFHGVTALSAWSRLEARAHYPSDVLAGVALGYFISSFIHDTFMGLRNEVSLQIQPSMEGVQATVAIRF